jgi:probable sporulation protein (polysaccharide deacetylase family)
MKVYVFRLHKLYAALIIVLIVAVAIFAAPRLMGKSIQTSATLKPIDKGTVDEKIMAFTCNVDWGNEYIPGILDILDEKNVKITFFVTGRWANNYPEILKEIVQRGHEIGNHGYGHKNHKLISVETNKEEILKTEASIKKVTENHTKYFAPPSGSWGENTLTASEQLGYKVILWTIDTIDWRDKDTTVILDRVLRKPVEGGIVLMHPTEGIYKSLGQMIDRLNEIGYKVGTVTDVLK